MKLRAAYGCSYRKDNREFGETMSVAWERRVVSEEHVFFSETKIVEDALGAPRITFSENSMQQRWYMAKQNEFMYRLQVWTEAAVA